MARSWHYPAWRRTLMQVVLCAILAASLGLAMFVSHRKLTVKLTTARNAGNIAAQLPAGWMLEEGNRPPVVFLIREPVTQHGGRSLTIRTEKQHPGISALDYLKDSSLLHSTMEVLGADEPLPVTIAGAPGLLVQRKRPLEVEADMPAMYETVWLAAAVLPSGQAISIELECPFEIDSEADRTIILNTAAGISVVANPPATRE